MRLRETGGAGKGPVARSTSGKELADVSRELRRVTAGRSALDHHAVLVGDEEHGIALTAAPATCSAVTPSTSERSTA